MREPGRIEFKADEPQARRLAVDVCVVGAGAAGVSASVEAARLGLRVCLLDGLPQIGGQSVNGLIGTLCGFYSAGPQPYRLDYGFASDVTDALEAAGAISYRKGRGTVIGMYDEHELAAIYARLLRKEGVDAVLGALLMDVQVEERAGLRTVKSLRAQTRYGPVDVVATTFIDASGDAVVAALAGATLQKADVPVYGTSMFSIAGLGQAVPPRDEVIRRLEAVGGRYGLERKDGFVFGFPGRDLCLVNLTHFQTPLEAIEMSSVALEARSTIERVMAFLRGEFASTFGAARVSFVGQPGVRQTRGIAALSTLTTEQVRSGHKPGDAIARCAWPIEFHGSAEGVHWELFEDDHITWVPLSCMISRDIVNLVAAGRCIDAEPFALSAVRVIGPCMATGAAAAAAALVGKGNLHRLEIREVQRIVADNIERKDRAQSF